MHSINCVQSERLMDEQKERGSRSWRWYHFFETSHSFVGLTELLLGSCLSPLPSFLHTSHVSLLFKPTNSCFIFYIFFVFPRLFPANLFSIQIYLFQMLSNECFWVLLLSWKQQMRKINFKTRDLFTVLGPVVVNWDFRHASLLLHTLSAYSCSWLQHTKTPARFTLCSHVRTYICNCRMGKMANMCEINCTCGCLTCMQISSSVYHWKRKERHKMCVNVREEQQEGKTTKAVQRGSCVHLNLRWYIVYST